MQLNLPNYPCRLKKQDGKTLIFDEQRKRYVVLTPEEWVRQHFLHFMIHHLGYPAALLAVEKSLVVNGLKKRCDAVLYNGNAEPVLIVEFKAPHVSVSQEVFDQVAVYNSKLKVNYFIVSNGLEHYCCRVLSDSVQYEFLYSIPTYDDFLRILF